MPAASFWLLRQSTFHLSPDAFGGIWTSVKVIEVRFLCAHLSKLGLIFVEDGVTFSPLVKRLMISVMFARPCS
jgi:hypothetical protein